MTPVADPARLLVVGDDPGMVVLLSRALRFAGYQVRARMADDEAEPSSEPWNPDLLVLDIGSASSKMPKAVECLGDHQQLAPVIYLSPAPRAPEGLSGLTVGGGEYVTKPFGLDDLLARIRAVLRRTRAGSIGELDDGVLRYADVELREDTYEVRRAGQPITLSLTEYKLLRYLMRNAGNVVTKAQILDHVWRFGYAGDPQVVECYMFRLRRKIDRTGPSLIQTVRGVGYGLLSR